MGTHVKNSLKRIIVCFLFICFALTIVSHSVFATTVKKPAKVKLTSVKATKANIYNKSTVTIKWKKVSKNVTAYQVYQRANNGKWKLTKTIKKNKVSAKVKVNGGKKYQYKVRAINKQKKVTKYGNFSKTKLVTIKKSKAVPDSGSYEYDFIDIETDNNKKTLSFKFEFTNLDDYDKNPANYFEIRAIQDGKELLLKSGSINTTVHGLTKVKIPIVFEYVSDNPILLQGLDKEYDNEVGLEYVIPID